MGENNNLANRIAALSPEKRALLQKMSVEKRTPPIPDYSIFPQTHTGIVPVSFAQEQLWFLYQLDPARLDYNMPAALRLQGELNVVAMESSLHEIVQRHEILRTNFKLVDSSPAQIIAPTRGLPVKNFDLHSLPPEEREQQAQKLLESEALRPFDLENGSLIRACLLKLNQAEHILLLVAHHIIFDAVSIDIFTRELAQLYENFPNESKEVTQPPLPIQYADYARWQRQWLSGERLEKLTQYWVKHLGGSLPLLELPTDHPRPASPTLHIQTKRFVLAQELTNKLSNLGKNNKASLFMVLLAAFNVLLHRYSGQEDILVGVPIANRTQPELSQLIGYFTNTLVIRSNLSANPSFEALLEKVRDVTLAAYEHQDLPFAKLIEILRPKRESGYYPLVRVAFSHQNNAPSQAMLPGLKATNIEISNGYSSFDLAMMLQEENGVTRGNLLYSQELFESATIDEMLENFRLILETISTKPEAQLSELPLTIKPSIAKESNLTANQLLVWLGQQLQPNLPIYNEIMLFTINGALDVGRFQAAFQGLAQRNASLRTVIQELNGIPQQAFNANVSYKLDCQDFSKEAHPADALDKFVSERGRISFDFKERLFDTALIKLSEDKFAWYLCLHQLITDGWTFALLYRRMSEIYDSLTSSEEIKQEAYPDYSEFIEYEAAYRKSAQFSKATNYWDEKLKKGYSPVSFYSRPSLERASKVERVTVELGSERTQAIKAIATQKGFAALTQDMALSNLFTMLFLAYLYRISGNPVYSLGVPFHNRNTKPLKEITGLVMTVCPLRVEIQPGETFLSLAGKVQAELRQTLQFSQYVTHNSPQRKTYDLMFNYLNATYDNFAGMTAEVSLPNSGFENNSLSLQVQHFARDKGLVLYFDFNCDLFSPENKQRAIRHFTAMLDIFLSDTNRAIGQIELLDSQEVQILRKFNAASTQYQKDKPVFRLFEEHAALNPNALALESGSSKMSYRELNIRANRLAYHLQRIGIKPDSVVGLCLERSPEALIGIIGIQKAGGAYLYLDPQLPAERREFMLKEAKVHALVTASELYPLSPEYLEHVVYLTDFGDAEIPIENPPTRVHPENLAYVVYTSGSTGTPKGVMVSHAALLNFTEAARQLYAITPQDRVLQFASLSFDTSAEEIFPCLASGGTLVLGGKDMLETPRAFFQKCYELRITVLDLPTAYWHILAAEVRIIDPVLFSKLRLVIIGGEEAYPTAMLAWQSAVGDRVKLLNTYGPTEATIVTTLADLREVGTGIVPIGKVIPNTRAYILSPEMLQMPIGAPGELYLSGSGLARGYINQPDTTASVFVSDPFSEQSGARMYRTGDMARYLPDGNIEYLGRRDRQLKVRGFRIEPGEIEAVLTSHPLVREAAVLYSHNQGRLVAYFAANSAEASIVEELRHFLARKLPSYMIPTQLVQLEAMPLTTNGKINRNLLPEPLPESNNRGIAPRTFEESLIAQIWANLLGLKADQISVFDNFFELGGHSLLGTQLISKLNNLFGVKTPLQALFDNPTIDGLMLAISLSKAQQLAKENLLLLLDELEYLDEEEIKIALGEESPFSNEQIN
ncbi:MAG: amino acid adenylation domain-containing protein [Chloroflexi bacterium]|uniref:Amino acid adenylation domain-containing protein n=1 Tax=Candidatus Chlorohelix allophototropha TaxID=3003348 RepID=A0A8T7LU92_9CHLR|nr:amino acid adenylation domain-containing protein [Chloroflexota bacterium]WJW67457.1 amino acid adenylation domain-containing protein [Chloroflexota bacterium L227-S17]